MVGVKHMDGGRKVDEKFLEHLFREYFASLMAFSVKILGDEDEARDVVQKVFISLWERRQSLDLDSSMKSYLFKSVHNRSLNVIRDRKKFSDAPLPELEDSVDVGTRLEALELEERIGELIKDLPEKTREVFELSRMEGLKYGEIAEKLGISVKTVENQMSRALRILREKLAPYLSLLLWIVINRLN